MNVKPSLLRAGVLCAAFSTFGAAGASAAPILADWDSRTLGDIGITVDETITSGRTSKSNRTATSTDFTSAYGDSFQAFWFGTPTSGDPADVLMEFTFTEALPAGSVLLVFDIDYAGETVKLSSDTGFPTLLDQGETFAGESSILPVYDPTTGTLSEASRDGNNNNKEEFSVFDVSGISELSVHYLFSKSIAGARLTFATPEIQRDLAPVPLPGSMPLAAMGLAGIAVMARRKAKK